MNPFPPPDEEIVMEYEIDEVRDWPQEESMLAPQLNPFGRRPDAHRDDVEIIGSQGQMHHFADLFQEHRTDM